MISYTNSQGRQVTVQDHYFVDIASDISTAGKKAVKTFKEGWFSAATALPTAIFYLLASPITDYYSGKPNAIKFTYYFEVRAKTPKARDDISKSLCSELSKIYNARREQYADSFESNSETYIKRITFKFTVKLEKG